VVKCLIELGLDPQWALALGQLSWCEYGVPPQQVAWEAAPLITTVCPGNVVMRTRLTTGRHSVPSNDRCDAVAETMVDSPSVLSGFGSFHEMCRVVVLSISGATLLVHPFGLPISGINSRSSPSPPLKGPPYRMGYGIILKTPTRPVNRDAPESMALRQPEGLGTNWQGHRVRPSNPALDAVCRRPASHSPAAPLPSLQTRWEECCVSRADRQG
jgi:hypothetical protein